MDQYRAMISVLQAGRLWRAQCHLLDLAHAHHLRWETLRADADIDDAWMCPACRLLVCHIAHTPAHYATALHEIGHCVTADRVPLLECELRAWEWAADHALRRVCPDGVIGAQVRECMDEYIAHAKEDRRHWVPDRGAPFWHRLEALARA